MRITDTKAAQVLPTMSLERIPNGQVFFSQDHGCPRTLYYKTPTGVVIGLASGNVYTGALLSFANYEPREAELILR